VYRVESELGRGGMAVVHAAWDTNLERPVALKVLATHLADDPAFRERFLREARLAARLEHEHVVRIYDVAELDGLPCIAMELLPGGTLEGGRVTRAEAAGVAAGLAHAHRNGVVHRDLKPANLLRAADGTVKIADFGIARAVEETMVTQAGTVLGTLQYLSPEQASGEVAGPPADVYSFAIVLDELLEQPTVADRALIDRCRARDAAERPTASDVAQMLSGSDVGGLAPTVVLPRRQRTRRPWLLAPVVAAVAILAAVVVVLATRQDSPPAPVAPVVHASTPSKQARNLEVWLRRNSR
jgi:serine/threonine-protein kinase